LIWHYRQRLRIGICWVFNEFSAGTKVPVNEQIVEILIHISIENFSLELQPNSEQNADEMPVMPSYRLM